jgi:hypothetical protein
MSYGRGSAATGPRSSRHLLGPTHSGGGRKPPKGCPLTMLLLLPLAPLLVLLAPPLLIVGLAMACRGKPQGHHVGRRHLDPRSRPDGWHLNRDGGLPADQQGGGGDHQLHDNLDPGEKP